MIKMEDLGLGVAEVKLTNDLVMIRRKGSSSTEVAKILGIDKKGDSVEIWLDRLVHARHEDRIGPRGMPEAQFAVHGVFVSVLCCAETYYQRQVEAPDSVDVTAQQWQAT